MRPKFPANNQTDNGLMNAKTFRYVFVTIARSNQGANDAYICLGQLSSGVSLASQIGAVFTPVDLISFARIPSKICQGTIGASDVWKVAALLTGGAWPNKRFQDKPMNRALLARRHQGDNEIACGTDAGTQLPPFVSENTGGAVTPAKVLGCSTRPHAPVIANAIAGKTSDVSISHVRIGVRHDRLLTGGCV